LLLTAGIVTSLAMGISRLDATVLAVGKRYVELTAGMATINMLNDTVSELKMRQEALTDQQVKATARLDEASEASQGLVTQVPAATAKEVEARTQGLGTADPVYRCAAAGTGGRHEVDDR
jgi:hypothetical protein